MTAVFLKGPRKMMVKDVDDWRMQWAREELVAPVKLSAEPEEVPVQAGI